MTPGPTLAADRIAALAEGIAADIAACHAFRDVSADLPALADAYAVQAEVARRLAPARGAVAGRKIAFNTAAQMDAMGLPEPVAGRVLARQVREGTPDAPAAFDAAAFRSFTVEPEIAAVLAVDVPPERMPRTPAEAAALIARLHPAFEIMDRRDVQPCPPTAIVAQNVFNAGLVLGGPGLPPAEVDPAALPARVTLGAEALLEATGTAPQDPFEAAAFLMLHAGRMGETLRAGEILLLGAHLAPRLVEAPARMTFDLGPLGAAAFGVA